ncbi:uncharacterized protein LOC118406816 [Branchiostoma floridae]|uniref:Uncharacterized protein LOC118406816 n=1 Tax=Branchiostoma floridae TaxID=7739 RepID=A0A9J7KAE3_BRAFL|nr:uncharacterized protein LOC118406816 [Branchiostoma floridae]
MACTIDVEEYPLLGIGDHIPSYGTDEEIIGAQQGTRRDPCGTRVHVMKTVFKGFGSFCAKLWRAIWPFLGFWWFLFCSIMQLVCLWRAKTDNGGHNETMGTTWYHVDVHYTHTTDNSSFANGTWWWSQCHQPYKVEKTISYSLIYGLFTFMSAILIIRWRYQINWDDLLRSKIKQTAVYDKRYLLALYVILWASAVLLNASLKCASCEQLFALRWTIKYFSHHEYEVPHYVCSFVTLAFYAIIYVPSFFCCSYVMDLTNALVSLASDTKQLANTISSNDQLDHILNEVSNRIKEKSWSRYSGIGKELQFFIKLTMFVGATVGFSFVNIYVSSQKLTLMEWNDHMTQLLSLAVTIMTPFFFVAIGVKKLHEAHEIFVSESRKAQVEDIRVTARRVDIEDNSETWDVIIEAMKENVVSIVNTEKELYRTALATIGVILWQLLGNLNKFSDTPNTNIEDERFALTYFASLTLLLAICVTFGLLFGLNMIPRCIKSGHRQGSCEIFLYSVSVGVALLAGVYTPWLIQFNGRTCPL